MATYSAIASTPQLASSNKRMNLRATARITTSLILTLSTIGVRMASAQTPAPPDAGTAPTAPATKTPAAAPVTPAAPTAATPTAQAKNASSTVQPTAETTKATKATKATRKNAAASSSTPTTIVTVTTTTTTTSPLPVPPQTSASAVAKTALSPAPEAKGEQDGGDYDQRPPLTLGAEPDPDSNFDVLELQGSAAVTSGSLSDLKTAGVLGAGIYAKTKKNVVFQIDFNFGTEGTSIALDGTGRQDKYLEFMKTPLSTVGGHIQVRRLSGRSYWGSGVYRIGLVGDLRVATAKFTYHNIDGIAQSQQLTVLAPTFAVTQQISFDTKSSLLFSVDVGMTSRFTNKVRNDTDAGMALGLETDTYAWFGLDVVAAVHTGNAYFGVEAMRLCCGNSNRLKEFSIIPVVGVRAGTDVRKSKPKKDDKPPGEPSGGTPDLTRGEAQTTLSL